MKALVYEGPRILTIRQIDEPVPGRGEVLIQVERAGICGSELGGYLGHNSLRKPPLVMGHEFSGVVAKLGDSAGGGLSVGDKVTANPLLSCGECVYCTTGRAQLCPDRRLIGAALPGAYADYVVVPAGNVYRLPDGLSFDDGALAEPLACAVHVCRLLRLDPMERLLIFGAGPIGLMVLQVAKLFGLTDLAVIDLNEDRLEIARSMGALTATDADELRRTGFAAPDAAVDAVGAGVTRRKAVESVKHGGRVAFTGLHEADSMLPINTAIRNEIATVGGFAYNRLDFEHALQWIAQGKLDFAEWTIHAPLEDGRECFERLIGNPGKVAKILLTLRG